MRLSIAAPGYVEAMPNLNAAPKDVYPLTRVRARIELPNGFEYQVAEMGNSLSWKVTGAGDKLTMEHQNTYAQLNEFNWSNT